MHCLKHPVQLDWDHVFPESWYPKTTPPNLEKWKVPSCIPSNSALGVIEDRLLIQLAHALFAMTAAEFLAKAWKLANDNARELGWIV
jgi:hypothetical protein